MPAKKTSHSQIFGFKPRVKQRPRLGRKGRVFTPEQTLEFERAVRKAWTGPKFDGPVSITVTLDKDKFRVTVTEERGRKPSALRGDVDNYIKSILDGLNGAAYLDDRQVYKIVVTKK